MTLDCPGCQSRLKLDPAKLPAGATTAVCPKCKTRVLLPNAAAAGDITVQCSSCSARLKVSVAKLKPAPSKSKCPKCANIVDLPARPPSAASAARSQASQSPVTRMIPRPEPPQQEAMTRRLDPREMGMVIGAGKSGAGSPAGSTAPIQIGEPMEQSADDLSQLIDEKVAALDDTGPSRAQAPAAARAQASPRGVAAAQPPAAEAAPAVGGAPKRDAAGDTMRRSSVGRSSSGTRQAPEFGAVAAGSAKRTSPAKLLSVLGAISGSLIGLAVIVLSGSIPPALRPAAPEVLVQALGDSLAPLLLLVVLSAIGGMLGGIAAPPEGQSAGVSLFRCTVASALLGLLAGVLFTLLAGPFDIMAVAGWTGALLVSGVLTGILGMIFRRSS